MSNPWFVLLGIVMVILQFFTGGHRRSGSHGKGVVH